MMFSQPQKCTGDRSALVSDKSLGSLRCQQPEHLANFTASLFAIIPIHFGVKGPNEERNPKSEKQAWKLTEIRHFRKVNINFYLSAIRYPMWVYDPATLRVLTVNKAGNSALRLFAKGISGNDHQRHPSGGRCSCPLADFKANQSNPTVPSIWRHRKKDGTLIDVEITSHEFQFGEHKTKPRVWPRISPSNYAPKRRSASSMRVGRTGERANGRTEGGKQRTGGVLIFRLP